MKRSILFLVTLVNVLAGASHAVAQYVRPGDRRHYPGGRDDSDLTVQPIRQQTRATIISDTHDEPAESPNVPVPQQEPQEEEPADTESPQGE